MVEMVIAIVLGWKKVFAQERTARRAIGQALAGACVVGRRTLIRSVAVRAPAEPGAPEPDWSAEYRLHARSPWDAQDLFVPILAHALTFVDGPFVVMATDDTRLKKTGKKIATARYGRDPMSPPFHVNLQRGLRFLHTSLIVPLHTRADVTPRAVPVWWAESPPVKKPPKTATPEQTADYRAAKKTQNLSLDAVAMFARQRERVDAAGGADKTLVFALDGSFTNKTTFRAELERTVLVGRVRKDAKLCQPGTGRRWYAPESFTPESVRVDETHAWQKVKLFHGGQWREVEYKECVGVLWRRGAGRRALRLLVLRPTPYRLTKAGKTLYREPAFLLCTDVAGEAAPFLQAYLDRLHIEVAHRELKQEFGVGQAQVRAPAAVARQPALMVAAYSALHLAALTVWGAGRAEALGPVARWQREKPRASCQDLLRHMRHEVVTRPELLAPFGVRITETSLLAAASPWKSSKLQPAA